MTSISHNSLRIERHVLRYLFENPRAQDTLEGIADWWVREICVEERFQEVLAAVTGLVEEGLLVEDRIGLVLRYQLAQDRLGEVRDRLRDERLERAGG